MSSPMQAFRECMWISTCTPGVSCSLSRLEICRARSRNSGEFGLQAEWIVAGGSELHMCTLERSSKTEGNPAIVEGGAGGEVALTPLCIISRKEVQARASAAERDFYTADSVGPVVRVTIAIR